MKKCKLCNTVKNKECFTKNKRNKDGLSYICKICKRKKEKEYYLKNNCKNRKLKSYHKNKHKYKDVKKEYDKNRYAENKSYYLHIYNKRRCAKIKATPKWADQDKIRTIYKKAKWLEELTGLKYHVDHIIPLQGDGVCGLHCWNNLQILEASLNLTKKNKYSGSEGE